MTVLTGLAGVLSSLGFLLAQTAENIGDPGSANPGEIAAGETGARDPGFIERIFGGPGGLPLMLVFMFAIIYFLMIRPERKRQKSRESMLDRLKKGDTVVTSAGIVAQVYRVEDKEAILSVDRDSKVKVRFLKSAISEVLSAGSSSGKDAEKPAKESAAKS